MKYISNLLNFIKQSFSTKEKIIESTLALLFMTTVFSVLLLNSSKYYFIIWGLFAIFTGYMFVVLFFSNESIKITNFVVVSVLLAVAMIISNLLNLWASFNSTNILMILLSNVFYQYFIYTDDFLRIIKYVFISVLLFALVFIAVYFKEILSFNFSRLGGEIANVNTIGLYFTIGFLLSLYYVLFQKKIYHLVFMIIFLFLGFTTGSVKVFVNMGMLSVIGLFLFFGKEKWIYTVLSVVMMGVAFIIVINIPMFSFLKIRIKDVIDTALNGNLTTGSAAIRLMMQKDGLLVALQKPLFGWGFNGYYRVGAYNSYSHNNYIELLVNFGLMGFALFQLLALYPMIKGIKLFFAGKEKNYIPFVILLGVFVMLTQYGMVIIDSKTLFILIALLNVPFFEQEQRASYNLINYAFIKKVVKEKSANANS